MTIPREFIDLLLSKIDIVDLINTYVPLRKMSGSNYFARCPFHNEKSASFSVSQPKQFFHCFGCDAHGNALDFMMQYERLSFPEAIESLASLAALEVPKNSHAPAKTNKNTNIRLLSELMEKAQKFFYDNMCQSNIAIEYLKNRGISGSTAKIFKIGYAINNWSALLNRFSQKYDKKTLLDCGLIIKHGENNSYYDRFRNRIMFPIENTRGETIGFGGRTIGEEEPKYLNSPETPLFQKGKELYGLSRILKKNRNLKSILVVEGYMDVISLYQHGITNSVATLGTATTANHILRLMRYFTELIFCFDGDNAGRNAAFRAMQTLLPLIKDHIQVRFLLLPENEDPDSLIRKEGKLGFLDYLKSAVTLSTFLFQSISQNNEITSLEGRVQFAAKALQFIKIIPSDVLYQSILLEELSKISRIDAHQLRQQMKLNDRSTLMNSPKNIAPATASGRFLPKAAAKTQNPMQTAIMLLIQNPHLIEYVTALPSLDLTNAAFFSNLIEIIRENPNITTGRIIEHWRGQKEEQDIAIIATTEHIIPEQGIKSEFIGALKQLLKKGLESEINKLMQKFRLKTLTEDEKLSLDKLLKQKRTLQTEN